jgi:hypothetical protein
MGNKSSIEKNDIEITNKAILDYSNGERYHGEVFEGQRNGFGTYFYQNGDKYEGYWHKNQKHGRGTFFFKNGEVFEGWWNKNKKDGIGTYYYNNGERYYGEWKENQKHGRGIVYMEEGAKFIGQFKNNKKHGHGELINKNGTVTYEEWKDDNLQRQSEKIKYTTGVQYDIDYNQFNSGTFEKYLETKTKQQFDVKSNQIKSKYFTLEFAKMLKSKNPENYYDSVRLMHHTNNLVIENPDVSLWNSQTVADFFKSISLGHLEEKILSSRVNGRMILQMDIKELCTLLGIQDPNEISSLNKSLGVLKKLQNENLKSFHKLNSIEMRNLNLKSNVLKTKEKTDFNQIEEEGLNVSAGEEKKEEEGFKDGCEDLEHMNKETEIKNMLIQEIAYPSKSNKLIIYK